MQGAEDFMVCAGLLYSFSCFRHTPHLLTPSGDVSACLAPPVFTTTARQPPFTPHHPLFFVPALCCIGEIFCVCFSVFFLFLLFIGPRVRTSFLPLPGVFLSSRAFRTLSEFFDFINCACARFVRNSLSWSRRYSVWQPMFPRALPAVKILLFRRATALWLAATYDISSTSPLVNFLFDVSALKVATLYRRCMFVFFFFTHL